MYIKNPFINYKSCGGPSKTRKRKILYILETAPTHSTDNDKHIYAVGKNIKNEYKRVDNVAWERGCEKSISICMFWINIQEMM